MSDEEVPPEVAEEQTAEEGQKAEEETTATEQADEPVKPEDNDKEAAPTQPQAQSSKTSIKEKTGSQTEIQTTESGTALHPDTSGAELGSGEEEGAEGEEVEGEEDVVEEEEEDLTQFPYGKYYEEITEKQLQQIAFELGLIKLYWPEQLIPDVDQRKHYPPTYSANSTKEKLLLWYTENFRRQFHYIYKDRKPLLLAAENECGLQKMVCTTIRPTTINFPEFKTWAGCAKFVADHLNFEPLEKPRLLPERLFSPTAVMARQLGNIFEYSTLLCSFLIGAGYDAYVVSGYSTRETCMFNQTRIVCPELPDFSEKVEEKVEEEEPKYVLKPPADLRSKFLLEMEMKKIRAAEDIKRKEEEEQRLIVEEFEKPAPDDIFGTRIHSCVIILPPSMGVEEPFFIDPLTGDNYDLSYPNLLGLESIWNHTNYWVNLQSCSEGCKNLKFDLTDLTCWEHILPGEPWHTRKSTQPVEEEGTEEISADEILVEKHLDMPYSWVDRLDISNTTYESRYPSGSKTVLYKKCKLEKFAPYVQEDGLVTRITTYEDYDWTLPLWVYEYYDNRSDWLLEIRRNLTDNSITEIYKRGRDDCIKEHTYYEGGFGVEDKRTISFYYMARHDGLEKLEMDPLYLIQHFKDRLDFLYYRRVDYEERGLGGQEVPKRIVLKLTEEFHRNPEKKADDDIARRTFIVSDYLILLKYHYGDLNVTAATREFIKPRLEEMAEGLTFNPDMTAGYQTDPTDLPPKQLKLYYLLEEQMNGEEKSLHSVRQMEDEVSVFLQQRILELTEPKLEVSMFNMERNEVAKEGMKARDKQMREQVAREVETGIDFLSPYFARLGSPENVTKELALKVREECLADFKQLMVVRINKIQASFEEVGEEIEAMNRWYAQEQDNLSKAEETAYLKSYIEKQSTLHVLEIRMDRFRDLATIRYQALESFVRSDKRLRVIYH